MNYVQVIISCKLYGNQADGFYAANALYDISEESLTKFAFTWPGANKFVPWIKTCQYLKKINVDLIRSMNFVKMQHRRWMDCIWTFRQQSAGRFLGLKELR